ncbi:helix-turn-helix domain-containing protein [Thermomonas sp.]|uniref:helix-turn-helix domain-containing protein n=1 Tax=Thermomonas sp. TaxID=1971895 RepID=UPI003BEF766F
MSQKSKSNQCHSSESEPTVSSDSQFRFSTQESELKDRIRAIIGSDSIAAFARRCGFDETLVRKYLKGSQPSARNLAIMAHVAGVTIDWLATGQGVRTRSELLALQRGQAADGLLPPDHPHARRWARLIELVEQEPDPDRRDAILADLYARAQEAAELAQLRRVVQALAKKSSAA